MDIIFDYSKEIHGKLLGFEIDLQAPGTPYKEFVLGFSWVVYIFEQYLSYRQYKRLHDPNPPESLADHEEIREKYPKSQAYSIDKAKFRFFAEFLAQVETTAIFLLDGLPWMWNIAGKILESTEYDPNEYEIIRSCVFVVLWSLLSFIISLPTSLWYTFVIEERHGFNKMTIRLFIMDTLKQIMLMCVIGLPVLSLVLYIIKWGGDNFFFYVWLFVLVFNFIMLTIYPTLIQPLFNKVTPLPENELRTKIEELASRINFPLKKLYVIDGSTRSGHSNAYFYGFFKNKRIVLFDTLIESAEVEEIVAIVGHELGHWYLNHTVKVLAIAQVQMFTLFFLFSQFINNTALYQSFGFDTKPTLIGFILFQYIYSPIDHVVSFLMNILSRKHEFEAGSHYAYGKKLGYAEQLRSGLIKIHTKNLGNLSNDSWFSVYHFSHPPLPERLNALMQTDKKIN
ncbi:1770_t:CDS:2 [Ambispora gerdemannii]|uniref:CAAX prenyl protease n=1 Tax=Ambispora gerdemannii TaxID=144530 RepID=A0A9N8V182_9GLOM|nr:1770_t:CDS:2 [Ambispora gerdemannii]